MIYHFGSKAGVDFGWRIFKLCGTNRELKHTFEELFRLNAWWELDVCLTMQQVCTRHKKAPLNTHSGIDHMACILICSIRPHLANGASRMALQIVSMGFYFFHRLTEPYEITLAVFGVLTTVMWVIGVAIAIDQQWPAFWWQVTVQEDFNCPVTTGTADPAHAHVHIHARLHSAAAARACRPWSAEQCRL